MYIVFPDGSVLESVVNIAGDSDAHICQFDQLKSLMRAHDTPIVDRDFRNVMSVLETLGIETHKYAICSEKW